VDTIAFSPDGKILATNELTPNPPHSDSVAFWDVVSGKLLRRTKATPKFINALTFSADGKTLFAGSGWGAAIVCYDVATAKPVGPALEAPYYVHNLALSPSGDTLAYGKDVNIQLQGLSTGLGSELALTGSQTFHSGSIFSPDGRRMASVSSMNQLCLWELPSQKPVYKVNQPSQRSRQWLVTAAFSPDGKLLATPRGDGMVQLWDATNGKKLRLLDFKGNNQYLGSSDVAFSPDGSLLAASGRLPSGNVYVRIWDAATWKTLPELTTMINEPPADRPKMPVSRYFLGSWEPTVVHRLAFAPDGRTLAMNRWQKTIPVWEVASGKERLMLQGHEESTVWLAYTRDSRTLASASWDNTIRLWDLETGKELRCLTGHRGKANSLVFTNDGNTLISAGDDSTILFWDVAAQTHRPVLSGPPISEKDFDSLWTDLASEEAGKAYRAMVAFRSSPADAVTLLARRLEPAASVDLARVNRLIAELDSNAFAVRSKASAELERLGDLAVPALNKKLAENPSVEARQRIRILLNKAGPWHSPTLLRQVRAVEVLEKIGTEPARKSLKKLAEGTPTARLTKEAAAAVARLK
jgi:WD40 repeat protein